MNLTRNLLINDNLKKIGICSYLDVLNHIPKKYDDLSLSFKNIDNEKIVLSGKVISSPKLKLLINCSVTNFSFESNNKIFFVQAFNRPYLKNTLFSNIEYILIGKYKKNDNLINLISINKKKKDNFNILKSIYSLPNYIPQYIYRRIVLNALKKIKIIEIIPMYFKKKYKLLNKLEAFKLLHYPKNYIDINNGLRVLKYEECLIFSLKLAFLKKQKLSFKKKNNKIISFNAINDFIKDLDFILTNSQKKAINEILHDMNNNILMYRLLQGDVGSGKTIVSAIALYGNFLRYKQGVFMVPTDILAKQHYEFFCKLFKKIKIKIILLIGKTKKNIRKQIENDIINNKINIIIGTHALFSDSVKYYDLGLIVIDEQHRFGVNQRFMLLNKSNNFADCLLMSATPIPRTLALTVSSNLIDISTLTDLPFKNKKVKTFIINSNDKLINNLINKSLKNNKQIYIIAPLITDDVKNSVEKLFKKYSSLYKNKVTLLHGKMSYDEKEKSLNDFKNNKFPIIISTTVIEVGLDIKTADLMIIYDANNFGLANLHQMRGRIGRDGSEANCLLICDNNDNKNKLEILVKSNDGLYIAEKDLEMRGPGELNGFKQSGLPNFNFVNIIKDFKMLSYAKKDADFILKNKTYYDFKKILNFVNNKISKENNLYV